MTAELPEELLLSLSFSIPCRERQICHLLHLLGPTSISPSTLVVHGVEATGKTLAVGAVLNTLDTLNTIVRSRECITTRHLLERAIVSIKGALQKRLGDDVPKKLDGRCESISAFVVELQHLLEGQEKTILVFDGIDKQREAAPTLLPAIARLGEMIPNLTTIMILTAPLPHAFHHSSIPHLHFPQYTKAEILSIASSDPLPLYKSSHEIPTAASSPPPHRYSEEDCTWLWTRFINAIWDSLGQNAARDIVSFRKVCVRLWEPFSQPVAEGHYNPRAFSKLMIKNKSLLQSESALVDSIVPIPATVPNAKSAQPTHNNTLLPYYPAHLLLSAYLASHNPPRQDMTLFSKTSLSKRKKRGGVGGKKGGHGKKLSRQLLLGPQTFVLERLFAILHAILPLPPPPPHAHGGSGGGGGGGAELMAQFATLVSLRLICRAGAGNKSNVAAAAAAAADVLEAGAKWRVNVPFEFVRGVASGVGFDLESYLIE